MATTLTNYDSQSLASVAIEAVSGKVAPLQAFSTKLADTSATKGDTIKVPVITAGTSSAFNASSNNYEDDSGSVVWKDVALDKHFKKTFALTDEVSSKIELEKLIKSASRSVLNAIQAQAFALVTTGNFTNEDVIASADIDYASFAELLKNTDDMTDDLKAVLNSTYYSSVLSGLTSSVLSGDELRSGVVQEIAGIQTYRATVPTAENLVGFYGDGSGIALATAILSPGSMAENVIDFASATDPETGYSIGVRKHYAPATGQVYITVEALAGVAVANASGLRRIVHTVNA